MLNENEVFLRVYKPMFTRLFPILGKTNFAVLLALASYMDKNGVCYPTQRQIADRMGVHHNTVNTSIKEMLNMRINGKPFLTVKKREGGRNNYIYTVHPISQIAIFDGQVEPID